MVEFLLHTNLHLLRPGKSNVHRSNDLTSGARPRYGWTPADGLF
jgi:hypothetical protein